MHERGEGCVGQVGVVVCVPCAAVDGVVVGDAVAVVVDVVADLGGSGVDVRVAVVAVPTWFAWFWAALQDEGLCSDLDMWTTTYNFFRHAPQHAFQRTV